MGAAEYIMGRKLAVLKAIQVRLGLTVVSVTPASVTPESVILVCFVHLVIYASG